MTMKHDNQISTQLTCIVRRNMTKRGKHLILLLNIISTFICVVSSVQIDCAKPVQRCPPDTNNWIFKKDEMKCAHDEGYVCIRDVQGRLFETCMVNYTILANSGNCPVIVACNRNKPHLGSVESYSPCSEEIDGCPPAKHEQYSIYQLFKYPRCIESRLQENLESKSENGIMVYSHTSTFSSKEKENEKSITIFIIIIIVISVILILSIGIFISYVMYLRKKTTYQAVAEANILFHPLRSIHESDSDGDIYIPLTAGLKFKANTEQHEADVLKQSIFTVQETEAASDQTINKEEVKNVQAVEVTDYGMGVLRDSLRAYNETNLGNVHIPVMKDCSVEVDEIYVPILLCDEFDKRDKSFRKNIDNQIITLDRIFKANTDGKLRFVFMHGEAGYGKTIQCQHITKLWCKVWQAKGYNDEPNHLEKILKETDFLFFIKMRDVNVNHTCIVDMVEDRYGRYHSSKGCTYDILKLLEKGQGKTLVLLDGLDEWNISENKKKDLKEKGIPNYNGLLNCTILVTMRSSNLMEVKNFCHEKVDTVVRLNGFDEKGIKMFTESIICNHFEVTRTSVKFHTKRRQIQEYVVKSPLTVRSLMKIPLLAMFCILTWCEIGDTGHSITTFYLSLVEMLIQRCLRKAQRRGKSYEPLESSVPERFKKYVHVTQNIAELSLLGKVAFSGLHSQNKTLLFCKKELKKIIREETFKHFLKMGLMSEVRTAEKENQKDIRIIFLHKTIQEFLASLYLWKEDPSLQQFLDIGVTDIDKSFELSMVLTFLSGFSSNIGCKISHHMTDLAAKDDDIQKFREYFASESYEKVFYLYNLLVRCYRECRNGTSIKKFHGDKALRFSISDIILHGRDSGEETIAETADILRYHTNDIQSLQMKFIADSENNGISCKVIKDFCDRCISIKSLNIDGYVSRRCRLFDVLSTRMTSLETLGFHNVAFTDNILTELFTKTENRDSMKSNLKALGLFYIRTPNDRDAKFKYEFSPDERIPSVRSGFESKRPNSFLSTYPNANDDNAPILKDILNSLLAFESLSTLRVSYMESSEDRNTLLEVVPQIKPLVNFGYHGSSIHKPCDEAYDFKVVEMIVRLDKLRFLFLSEIIWNQDELNLGEMCEIEKISLQDFMMEKSAWLKLIPLLSHLTMRGKLETLVLTDTNIDGESLNDVQKLPGLCTYLTDERSAW